MHTREKTIRRKVQAPTTAVVSDSPKPERIRDKRIIRARKAELKASRKACDKARSKAKTWGRDVKMSRQEGETCDIEPFDYAKEVRRFYKFVEYLRAEGYLKRF